MDRVDADGGAMTPAAALWLLAGLLPPGAAARPSTADPCRLLTEGEIAAVSGGKVVERKSSSRSAGDLAIGDCFFRSEPFDSSVSLEIVRPRTEAAKDLREHWETVFHEEGEPENRGRPEAGEKEEHAPPREVEGVGDEAFWLGNPVSGALYVLRGDAYLRISVGGTGGEPVHLEKAIELARKALGRI